MMINQYRKSILAIALVAFSASWFLPVVNGLMGYEAAISETQTFMEFFTENITGMNPFVFLHTLHGWFTNELFLIGLYLLYRKSTYASPVLGFMVASMLSWQIIIFTLQDFEPKLLLIGYWLWVLAGVLLLALSLPVRPARLKVNWVSLVIVFPILNAILAVIFDTD